MKHFSHRLITALHVAVFSIAGCILLNAQQLPDPHFEDWSGGDFNGKPQLKSWQISNVSQTVLGVTAKANMGEKTTGRTGSALKVYDAEIGAAGVTETSPGYATCGEVWLYFAGLTNLNASTAGSKGGIKFTYRPDSIAVWVKREGADVAKQAYQIVFYSWKGTSKGTSYKGKDGSCTDYTVENEESDIRQKNDANECNTSQYATQIAEGWLRDTVKQGYSDWTRISIPISYFVANEKPEMCNVIFSAGNYPNKRDPKGLYAGLSLTVDDVELIYNSTIDELRINDTKVRGFSASTVEFTKANEKASYSPAEDDFTLFRSGRQLDASEYTVNINGAAVDNDKPVLITVKAEDGSSQTTYQIKFTSTQSSNYRPESITYKLGDKEYTLPNWNANAYNYEVSLPYGTTQTPQIIVTKSEATQTEKITQPTGPNGTATVVMTAQNGASQTYTIKFTVAELTDNTLKNILIDGEALVGFSPTKNNYDVELPLGTSAAPKITWESNYPTGAQTVTLTSNELSGSAGKATITVQVPGNKTIRTYTLNYLVKASSYAFLADLQIGGVTVDGFSPNARSYFYDLPMGTTAMPQITYTKGQAGQTITIDDSAIENLSGDYKIIVTAEDGTQVTYYITFTLLKSSNVDLKAIYVNGTLIAGFSPETLEYLVEIDASRTEVSVVTADKGEDDQTVSITKMSGPEGTATVKVTAADGKTRRVYTITTFQNKSTDNTLKEILVGGKLIDGFQPQITEYSYTYTGTKPEVTYTVNDQTASASSRDRNGVVTITVTAQDGSKNYYYVTLVEETVELSDYAYLEAIYVDGVAVAGFASTTLTYEVALSPFAKPSEVTFDAKQGVQVANPAITWNVRASIYKAVINVTAEDGVTKNTYTLTFVEGQGGNDKSNDATLSALLIDGVQVEGFAAATTDYQYVIPAGGSVPTVSATTNHAAAKAVVTQATSVSGKATVAVTAEDGVTTKTYSIQFSESTDPRSTDATLKSITVSIEGTWSRTFSPSVTEYTYTLPTGTTTIPQVSYEVNNSAAIATVVQPTSVDGDAVITVMAEHPDFSKVYTIHFTEAKSNDANLTAIMMDGVQIDGFSPQTTLYRFTLQQGAAVPEITYILSYPNASASVSAASQVPGSTSITVIAQDGTTRKVYTVRFDSEDDNRSTDATLGSLTIDAEGSWNFAFSADRLAYTVVLPEGTTAVPQVSFTTTDAAAVAECTQAVSVTGTATIIVTAENPDYQLTYTVQFVLRKNADITLQGLQIDGVDLEGFDPSIMKYNVELPSGTETIPTVTATKSNDKQQVSVVNQKPQLPTSTVVTVTAEDGTKLQYVVTFTIAKSNLSLLDMIYLNGQPLSGFKPTTLNYDVNLGNAVQVPTITVEKQHNAQTIEITTPRSNDYAEIRVLSEDHSQTTVYKLHFYGNIIITPKQKPQLTSLKINGKAVDGFSADVYEYTVAIPQDITSWSGLVEYEVNNDTRSDILQKSDFVQNGECLIILTSNDGKVFNIYKVQLVPEASDDATLKSVSFNGVKYDDFMPYTLTYNPGIIVPTITYEKQNPNQTVIYRELTNTKIEIEVTAADNKTKQTYTFNFKPSTASLGGDQNNGISKIVIGDQTKNFDVSFDFSPYAQTLGGTDILWTLDLPEGVDQLPEIIVTPSSDKSKVYIQTELSKGKADVQIQIVPEDISYAEAYNLELIFHKSKISTLKSITYGSTTVLAADFPDDNIFNIDLPLGEEYPNVSYELGEEHQAVALLDNKTSKTILSVQAQDESVEPVVYVLNFAKGLSADKALKKVFIDGEEQVVKPVMNYVIPLDQITMPVVTYEANDEKQNILQVDNGSRGTTIIVVAEDGTFETYKVNFTHALSSVSTLSDLQVYKDGSLTSIFVDGTNDYEVTVSGDDAVQVPAVMPVPTDENAVITVTYGWFGEPTIIHVAAPDGDPAHVTDYTITFKQQKSSDATLKGIELVDNASFMFDYDQRKYDNIVIAQDATTHPEIKWEKNDADQKVQFVDAGLGETTKIIVTSPDGTNTETYEFTFSKVADISENNELKAIFVNGMSVSLGTITDDGKGNKVSECSVVLPLGVDSCHIEYVTSYSSQTVLVSNMGMGKTSSLKVLSNRDGVDDVTYFVTVKSVVQGININGVPYDKFDPTVYDYIYVEESADDKTPEFVYDSEYKTKFPDLEITASSNKKFASLLITDNATGEEYKYTISVYYKADDEKLNLSFDEFTSTKTTGQPMWKFGGLYGGLANDYQHVAYRVKPIGWYAPADCEAIDHLTVGNWITGVREYYAGEEVNESGTIVHTSGGKSVRLYTVYSLPSITSVPGVISLSSQTYSFNTTASLQISTDHTSSFGSPITYRNTPDRISLWHYSPDDISEVAEGVHTGIATGWSLYIENNGTPIVNNDGNLEYAQQWSEYSKDISYGDDYIPNTLDIRISSSKLSVNDGALNPEANLLGTTTANINQRNTRIMYIDDMQFHYNSTITSGRVLNTEGTIAVSGSNINVTLSDPNFKGIPQLVFNNEVSGYQHEILWNEDFIGGTVRSYAENMTYTDYTLTTNSTNSRYLKDILVGGKSVWNGNSTINYTLPYGTTELPSIESVLRDHRQYQTISLEQKAKGQYQALIRVWNTEADYEANPSSPARTYTLNLNWSNTETNTLADIKEGDATIAGFEAGKNEYTTEVAYTDKFKTITYTKAQAGQQVTMTIDSVSDVKRVVTLEVLPEKQSAESRTYTITQTKQKPLNSFGKLSEVNANGPVPVSEVMLSDKSDIVLPTYFKRDFPTDTIVQTFTTSSIKWDVRGSQGKTVYNLDFSTSGGGSNDMTLSKLNINGDDQNIDLLLHTVKQVEGVRINAVQNADGQTISAGYNATDSTFNINVEAADKSDKQTYTVKLTKTLSTQALLDFFVVQGYKLTTALTEGVFDYTLVPDGPTPMPARHAPQRAPKVSLLDILPAVQANAKGATKDIVVTYKADKIEIEIFPEDEDAESTLYTFTIQQPTQDAGLDDITMFGLSVPGFSSETENYAEWEIPDLGADAEGVVPVVGYQSSNPQQTVSINDLPAYPDAGTLVVTAKATNGTSKTYTIPYKYAASAVSSNCLLAALEVNGSNLADINSEPNKVFSVTGAMLSVNPVRAENVQVVDVTTTANQAVVKVTAQDGKATNTYTINFTPSVGTSDNTLIDVYLNGTKRAVVAGEVVTYTVDDDAKVSWILTEEGQTVVRSDEEDVVVLSVTAPNGVAKAEYRLKVIYNTPYSTALQTIRLDGKEFTDYTLAPYIVTPAKFVPQTTTYRIDLQANSADTLPTIDAVKAADYQTIDWNTVWRKAGATTDTLAVVNIRVTTPNNLSETYTLHFIQAINTDASPADLLLDEIPMLDYAGVEYDPAQTNYTLVFEQGAYIPTVTALLKPNQDTTSVVRTAQTEGNPFEYKTELVVRAQAGNTKTYTVTIQVPQPIIVVQPCTDKLADILVGGNSWSTLDSVSRQFSADRFEYDLYLPAGTKTFPSVEGYLTDPDNSCLVITEVGTTNVNANLQTAVINIDSYDSENNVTPLTYTVNLHILPFTDATIESIYIGEEQIQIVADSMRYTVVLPVGTREYPLMETIECEMNESHATYSVSRLDDAGVFDYNAFYQIHTVAQSGDTKDYYLTFVVEKDSVADLSEIVMLDAEGNVMSIDNLDFSPEFDSETTEYTIVLPRGTAAAPDFSSSIRASEYATMSIEKDMTSATNGTITITVTAENGNKKAYIIHVSVDVAHTALLSDIVLDITTSDLDITQSVDNFDPRTNDYTQSLPYGVSGNRNVVITPVPADNATYTIQRGATLSDITYIVVTAEDGITQNTYTIVFDVERSTNASPLMLYLDGVAMDATELKINDMTVYVDTTFDADYYEYRVTLPAGTETIPVVTALEADTQQVITIATNGMVTTVTVVAGAGRPTNEYLVEFEVAKYGTNTLEDLTIYGQTVAGFRRDSNYYVVNYPAGTPMDSIFSSSDISWTLTDPQTSTAAISQSDSLTWLITVTAENGSQNVYVISVGILLSNNALLDSLLVGGVMINDFNPLVYEYTYYLYQGQPLVDVVGIPQDSMANVTVLLGEMGEYTYINVIAADDSTTATYKVLFQYSPVDLASDATDDDVCLRHISDNTYRASAAKRNVQLAILDVSGKLLYYVSVPVIEANESLCESETGVEIRLEPNQTYLYLFVNNLKNKVSRGKIMHL